mmetsp:Transcript_12438/g.32523  ORF Transcript_12438/g.32523 Transcript_12438/m.32523 type:complete len:518 (+) Transcript_12438:378-1931(+)
MSDVAERMQIDVEPSVSILGLGSASAKVEFFRELKMQTNNVAVLVHATHQLYTQSSTDVPVPIDDKLIPENSEEGVRAFYGSYGDSYVNSISLGAIFYAVYVFETTTASEQTRVTEDLKAQGVGGPAEVQMGLNKVIGEISENHRTRVRFVVKQLGTEAVGITPDTMMDFAHHQLPNTPIVKPVVLSWTMGGYEQVYAFRKHDFIHRLAVNRMYFLQRGPTPGERGLLQNLTQVLAVLSGFDSILHTYAHYGHDPVRFDQRLLSHKLKAEAQSLAARRQVSAFLKDPFPDKLEPPEMSMTEVGVPSLNFESHRTPAYGGNGGTAFNDVEEAGGWHAAVRNRLQPKLISFSAVKDWKLSCIVANASTVNVSDAPHCPDNATSSKEGYWDSHVDELIVDYGQGTIGKKTRGRRQAGTWMLTDVLDLRSPLPKPIHTVSNITVYHKAYVSSLTVRADDGHMISASSLSDRQVEGPFTIKPPDAGNWRLIGFHGRCEQLLDSLGALYVKLLPFEYTKTPVL